ncbi:hypothetical protein TNCV_1839311 [Trichonephila clavipes]|nr:hypothetical protein TNCV_1839311 [Trichonephila clavipes]
MFYDNTGKKFEEKNADNYFKDPGALQEQLKKALKKHSQNSWTKKLEALNTTDNSVWQCRKFFRKKRYNIPNLNTSPSIANGNKQKANLLALTLKNNFIENKRPDDKICPIDDNITNTLEDFFYHPPLLPIAPTNRDEITDYVSSTFTNDNNFINSNQYGFTWHLPTYHPLCSDLLKKSLLNFR